MLRLASSAVLASTVLLAADGDDNDCDGEVDETDNLCAADEVFAMLGLLLLRRRRR